MRDGEPGGVGHPDAGVVEGEDEVGLRPVFVDVPGHGGGEGVVVDAGGEGGGGDVGVLGWVDGRGFVCIGGRVLVAFSFAHDGKCGGVLVREGQVGRVERGGKLEGGGFEKLGGR